MRMRIVDEILERAKHLSAGERAELLLRLDELAGEEPVEKPMPGEGPYAHTLAMAGIGHSDFTDVSSDKYQHLAVAYADEHDD